MLVFKGLHSVRAWTHSVTPRGQCGMTVTDSGILAWWTEHWNQKAWDWILLLPLISYLMAGKFLSSLYLNSLICKVGIIAMSNAVVRIKCVNTYKELQQCLTHHKHWCFYHYKKPRQGHLPGSSTYLSVFHKTWLPEDATGAKSSEIKLLIPALRFTIHRTVKECKLLSFNSQFPFISPWNSPSVEKPIVKYSVTQNTLEQKLIERIGRSAVLVWQGLHLDGLARFDFCKGLLLWESVKCLRGASDALF